MEDNKRIYIAAIIISLLLLIPSCIYQKSLFTVLSGIGGSGIAAALMAIFIEREATRKNKIQKQSFIRVYLNSINSQLKMLIERVLWFEERTNDVEYDWSRPIQDYSSLQYMLWASIQFPESESITFQEAKVLLEKIGHKYNLDQQSKMNNEAKNRTYRLFAVIASTTRSLLAEVQRLNNDKLILHSNGYLDINTADALLWKINCAIGLMNAPGKNYDVAIKMLVEAVEQIRDIGGFSDGINIGLHGSIGFNEL